jgi:hypothetical protein
MEFRKFFTGRLRTGLISRRLTAAGQDLAAKYRFQGEKRDFRATVGFFLSIEG